MNWSIETNHYEAEYIADNGNRFLVGNGALGVRGTLEEHRKPQLVAVNLAGMFDQVGTGWREPLNAPNPFYTTLAANGTPLCLPDTPPEHHTQRLDFSVGVVHRTTVWRLATGQRITLETQRFASMANPNLVGMRYTVASDAPVTLTLFAGIDADVWDIHGPHFAAVQFAHTPTETVCFAATQTGKGRVAVRRHNQISATGQTITESLLGGQRFQLMLAANCAVTLTSMAHIFTTLDGATPDTLAQTAPHQPFDEALAQSCAAWGKLWAGGRVEIDGDQAAETAVNYSLYHLNAIAPRQGTAASIAARGLSGQTYKGAVFWDSELFILDYFLATQPDVAKRMVRYRIDTLAGAQKKAAQYGWQGAFYAWESQEGGLDACSDYNVTDVFTGRPVRTYFKDKQVHISAAVVWAIAQYIAATGDTDLLVQGGYETVLECARFYHSLLVQPILKQRYEIHDVIGPDEYHERVNNNAYTNRMALFCFETALEYAEMLGKSDPFLAQLAAAKERLFLQTPDENGIVEQFDGYFMRENATLDEVRSRLKDEREYWGGGNGVASDTQIIKQADVVALLALFSAEYSPKTLQKNWEFYEPRTEHGSSLSACMYALLACKFGDGTRAYPFFMKSATAEIKGGGKQWAGLVYIGGTHPAAAGGAWKVLAQGFAGLHLAPNGTPSLAPCLPSHWQGLRFWFTHGGKRLVATIDGETAEILPAD